MIDTEELPEERAAIREADEIVEPIRPSDLLSAPKTWAAVELYNADALERPEGLLAGHVLCPESVALVVGPGGAGKSFLLLFLARHIAGGLSFGELPTKAATVLYLSEEMTAAELRARLHEIFTRADLEALGSRLKFRCRSGIRIDTDAGIVTFRELLESEGNPEFVIVDGLSDVHQLDENKNSAMGPALKSVRDRVATPTKSCIAFIHHAGKPTEFLKGSDRTRGASAMRDVAADVLTVDRGADDSRVVKFAKVRHGQEPPPFAFMFSLDERGGTTLSIGSAVNSGPTQFQATKKLLDLLAKNGGQMIPVDLKEAAMEAFGWSKATYFRHQKVAVESGLMVKDDTVSPSVFRPAKVG